MTSRNPIEKNRKFWNRSSESYQRAHGRTLEQTALNWGVWRIPESQLDVLGDLRGRDVLELGCGAAQWSIALLAEGANAVGLDFSERQLAAARTASTRLALVQASAEELPFDSASFDVVFCDHGAMSFARPEYTVPEAARVLRPGGLFAFCMSSPLRDICWDPATDAISSRLARDYFGLSELEDAESVCYQRGYGDWIDLFRESALRIEALIELRAPQDATTSYADYVPAQWARRWPAENIWKLIKEDVSR